MALDQRRTDADIYAAHAGELVRFATGIVGPVDAPDVVAESFASLLGTTVWADAVNPRALLYRRVLYDARSWTRSKHRRRRRELRVHDAAPAEFPELLPEVGRAVERLSPQQRAVVFLTYWEDLTPHAIAALLDVSDGTVRKQLARARNHLRKVLA
jgi:RNA polymerase sigma-70 factor (ECF subfamily)